MKKIFIAALLFGSFASLTACRRNTSTDNMSSRHSSSHSSTVPGVPSTNSPSIPDIITSPIISPSIDVSTNTPNGSQSMTNS